MDFNRATRQLLKTSAHGRISIQSFEKHFPEIARQIRLDANASWLACWGQSRNWDELENQAIVDPKILTVIGRLAKYPIRIERTYHAGLIHTYGYLFSRLKTKYGYKRERWTSGILETGLGLPKSILSPDPVAGTLLQNVTQLLTRIAFGKAAYRQVFAKSDSNPLSDYDFASLKIERLEEVTKMRTGETAKLLTDFVAFPHAANEPSFLLIYSMLLAGNQNLFTCFPVNSQVKSELTDQVELKNPITARFNAAISISPNASSKRRVVQLKLKN